MNSPLLLLLGFTAPMLASPDDATAADKPNIVWLTTEDNSANWYRLYDKNGAPTPNIERLAEHGLVFNNAYSCAPVCSTARSTIISGCYGPRLGAQYHRRELPVAMPGGVNPFPWYLRQAGYYTTNNSKTDYNFRKEDMKDAWDESSRKATYRNREPGQPFFHVQNYTQTHEGQLFGDLPKGVDKIVDPSDVEVFPYHPDTPLFREKYAQYLTRQHDVDSQLGKMIDQLEADGLLNDTFIFHYGDHGGVLPGSKGYARNDGLQVAMVVYVPRNWKHLAPAEPGSRVDGFVEFVDLSATALNLAGIDIPEGIDGRPFLGEDISLEELNERDTAFGYAERFDEKYDMVRFLRKGKYTYQRNYQPFNFDGLFNEYRYKQPAYREWRDLHKEGKLNEAQAAFFEPRPAECLYDLERDPHEVNNLADDPKYADILADMRTSLEKRLKGMPDLGFIPEPVFVSASGGEGEAFGRDNKERIAELIDIADLELVPFDEAQSQIAQALQSKDPLKRYWGLIVCSAFGDKAARFVPEATKLAASDENLLVRARAAEFLGLSGTGDPVPVLVDVLRTSTDPIEANLILNTVVLLRDGEPGIPFDFSKVEGAPWFQRKKGIGNFVQRRIAQFRGE
ncbi:Arylsulfatase [Planctomycetes bacterium Pan216]|uniref:Arylsulfatase n=1 Tax=Kolteria novifilia TaxID=2527975 RepID=A0A518AZ46_9BACT|nr:Arylsulfatase [Planctomycetes bacterium Pan216]